MKQLYSVISGFHLSLTRRGKNLSGLHKLCIIAVIIVSVTFIFCENIMDDLITYNEIMEILSVDPPGNATGVAINTDISARFTNDVDMSTVNTLTFSVNSGAVSGSFSYDPGLRNVIFTPASELLHNTLYTVDISQGLMNVDGKFISAPFTWSFTTAIYYFNVVSVFPLTGGSNISQTADIVAEFDDNIDIATVTNATFLVDDLNPGTVAGIATIDLSQRIVTFNPGVNLAAGACTVTLTTGIKNLTGDSMATNYSWSFTVAAAPVPEIYVMSPLFEVPDGGTYDFGSSIAPVSFDIGNSGNGPLTISNISLGGADAAEFILTVIPVLPATVNAGTMTSGVFTVQFNPSSTGNKSAFVTITNDDGDESVFDINLTAVSLLTPAPEIQVVWNGVILVSPTSTVDFGTIGIGDTGTQTIIMQNIGTANLVVTNVSIGGSDPGYYWTDFGAVPATIAPGASKTFNIYFSAPVKVNTRATITFQNNDSDESSFVVKLKGRTMP